MMMGVRTLKRRASIMNETERETRFKASLSDCLCEQQE